MNVDPVNMNRSVLAKSGRASIKRNSSQEPLFSQSIASGVFMLGAQPRTSEGVYQTILDLMAKSSKVMIEKFGIESLDALSMLGRALFFRFLWDRGAVLSRDLPVVCPQDDSPGECFDVVGNCVATCRWLDETFNGDLLPFSAEPKAVYESDAERTDGKVFLHTRAILEGWKQTGGGEFQLQNDWDDLDFRFIADLWGAVKVTRASSSGPPYREYAAAWKPRHARPGWSGYHRHAFSHKSAMSLISRPSRSECSARRTKTSLKPAPSEEWNSRFDLMIGNPLRGRIGKDSRESQCDENAINAEFSTASNNGCIVISI